MICVVKMDNPKDPLDQGMPTRVRLVGPFASGIQAMKWATSKENNPHDNPCWQIVDISASSNLIVLEAP